MAVNVVIVTYNRKFMLNRCLAAVTAQTHGFDHILIVDNASTDGTYEMLSEGGWLGRPDIEFLALPENIGGAGGFEAGLRKICKKNVNWIWVMDDDAIPHPTALDELLKVAVDPANVYGSLAVSGNQTAWKTTVLDPALGDVTDVDVIPPIATVQSLPFLGFMIHRSLIDRIGFPDPGFFIAADDVEYCLRAQKRGAKIFIAGKSHIEHPKAQQYEVRVMWYVLNCISLSPWKRYYDTRNRILIARKYYGLRLFTRTIPGSFVRLFAALVSEPRKGMQFWAWCCGMFDGLFGIKGKRHEKWGIKV